jgi:dTDP-4-amino-4,6-dideoxygalactose transaminase
MTDAADSGPGLGRIPFNRPELSGNEFEYMRRALAAGHISGDGAFTRRASELLTQVTGAEAVLLTTSCTHALELAALLLRVGPGDEFIVPPFTFASTVNAFVLRGAQPVFVDIRPDTLNIDESLIEGAMTEKTRAIAVVHYAGVGAEMDTILEAAEGGGVPVIEDNAHGLFGTYRGRPLGSLGLMSTLSFHETKNVHCGEGGALVLNDASLLESAEIIREKGTNRSQFFRGHVDKYTWVAAGSSYLPSDLLAAFLTAQLESADRIQARRLELWDRYQRSLTDWAGSLGARLPVVPSHCEHPAHLFYLTMPRAADQLGLIAHLDRLNVHAVFHYVPLDTSPAGRRFGKESLGCPVALDISSRLVRLPLYPGLSDEEQSRVIDGVRSYRS